MVCGTMSMVNARGYETYTGKEQAKMIIDKYEEFKAKHPKTYKACFEKDYDSEHYSDYICEKLFDKYGRVFYVPNFSKFEKTYYQFLKEYGEEGKAKMLENGVSDWHGGFEITQLLISLDSVLKLAQNGNYK